MSLKVSRRGQVPPFIVMDVMTAAAERQRIHGDVLHLEVGQPATPAPEGVREAAKRAIDAEVLGYSLALGITPLRERIARHYAETYGARVPAERVMVTAGSSGGFLLAFLAAFEAGDRVALASPSYPAYRNILTALGLVPVELPTDRGDRYQPTLEKLAALDRKVDGLILASPSNPTGTMVSPDELRAIAGYCHEAGIRLISDEIYHGITFGREAATAAACSPSAIVVNSFSKYYSMTGWRLGWLVVPDDLTRAVECLAQNFFISPTAISQHAALAAFDCRAELEANLARYAANRALLLDRLPRAGFTDLAPSDGAFYLYADIGSLTNDSTAFCRRMLEETGIAATPGVDFDPARGHRTMRFSFAGSTEDMAEAAARLQRWLG
ncbi:MAG: pyridoxal phosphate-dependent aminotransferase [Azospirillaceae bacterium]